MEMEINPIVMKMEMKAMKTNVSVNVTTMNIK